MLVSEKNVLNESSQDPIDLSESIWPSSSIPCSFIKKYIEIYRFFLNDKDKKILSIPRQNNSQHELPIWTPACPIWTDIISL